MAVENVLLPYGGKKKFSKCVSWGVSIQRSGCGYKCNEVHFQFVVPVKRKSPKTLKKPFSRIIHIVPIIIIINCSYNSLLHNLRWLKHEKVKKKKFVTTLIHGVASWNSGPLAYQNNQILSPNYTPFHSVPPNCCTISLIL